MNYTYFYNILHNHIHTQTQNALFQTDYYRNKYKIYILECSLNWIEHLTHVVHSFFSDWEKITTIHNIIGTDISNLGIFRNGYSIHYDFLFNAIVIHKL